MENKDLLTECEIRALCWLDKNVDFETGKIKERKMKEKISKFFSRRWLAFIVASVALFTGNLDGWSWVVFSLAFVGLLTFEKANLSGLSSATGLKAVDSTETEGE